MMTKLYNEKIKNKTKNVMSHEPLQTMQDVCFCNCFILLLIIILDQVDTPLEMPAAAHLSKKNKELYVSNYKSDRVICFGVN